MKRRKKKIIKNVEQAKIEENLVDEQEETRGILPDRSLKKNIGCGG